MMDESNHVETRLNQKYIDVKDQHEKREVVAHDGSINDIHWMNEGANIVSCGTDNKVRYWDALSGKNTLRSFHGLSQCKSTTRFTVAANHRSLFIPTNTTHIHQYSLDTGRMIARFSGHYQPVRVCLSNPFNQDLYSCGGAEEIFVWTCKQQNEATEQIETRMNEERNEEKTERQLEDEAQDMADREAQMSVRRVRKQTNKQTTTKKNISPILNQMNINMYG